MFPYTFANLIILWTFLIFFQQDCLLVGLEQSIGNNLAFILVFATLAYYFYGKKPTTRTGKARAIAFNIAVLPLLFINIVFMPKVFLGESIGSSGMAYLLPMIYSPGIFIVVWFIAYFFVKETADIGKNYE